MEKKILIMFYSLTGNTKMIAETIKSSINADIQEVKPVKELDSESGLRFMVGGMQASLRFKPKLKPINSNPLNYDLIFIGSPVWAWQVSPPIRSLLKMYDFSNKKIAVWCCCGGKGIKAMKRIKKLFRNAKIIGNKIFQDSLTLNTEKAKEVATEWAKDMLND
jgi:flavodoxin